MCSQKKQTLSTWTLSARTPLTQSFHQISNGLYRPNSSQNSNSNQNSNHSNL